MYNKQDQSRGIRVGHSSPDRKCPSMKAMIGKYKQNTDYQNGNSKQQQEVNKQQPAKINKMHKNKPGVFQIGDR
jgi:hypothetical protein